MRPRALTPELKAEICCRIADGATVRQLAADPSMPAKSTIFLELKRDLEFAAAYAEARELQFESWEDELLTIADDESADVARAKLRVNTRQWIMSKRLPRRYGDRVAQEISGPDGGPVEIDAHETYENARRIAFLLEKGRRAKETIDAGKS